MAEISTLILNTAGTVSEQSSPFLVFRLSWTAYLRELWALVIRLLLCVIGASVVSMGLDRFAQLQTQSWLPVLGLLFAIGWTVYSVMLTNSVRLYSDETGVWMSSGVFPWEKGMRGVQWRDLGQAGYTQSFLSWLCKSYDVRISHRFTAGAELYLRNVHQGNLAVEHVNGVMARLQGRVVP